MKTLFVRVLLIFSIVFVSCTVSPPQKIRIAISKASGSDNYKMYSKWLTNLSPDLETIDLYKMSYDSARIVVLEVDGLLLSGGPDVHPGHYNQSEDTARCSIDLHRDSLEFELIRLAVELKIPIMAICRGEQILNAAKGGSLIVDIPQDVPRSEIIHQLKDGDAMHEIIVEKGTYLYEITQKEFGIVNSSHHQAVNVLADDFEVNARTQDGLIEAYSYKNHENMPFMLAVQWHPERLDYSNPFSIKIAEEFLKNVQVFHKVKAKK